MKLLWAPWRISYVRMPKSKGCILCDKPKESDDVKNHILFRGKHNFVIINAYPYNPGHLMVAPYRHIGDFQEMPDVELLEHQRLVGRCVGILKEVLTPAGFNLGVNMGRVAGAGVEGHIHTHIVPRWDGDNNFMPVVADVKVISEGLAETYQHLKDKF